MNENTLLLNADQNGVQQAGQLLKDGQTVAIPTETVYGLAANGLNGEAVARIFQAKGRPADNPLILHIAYLKDWEPLVTHIPDNARKLADAFWPGPLTIILPAADIVPKEVTAGLSTVAVRFPAHPVARAVIKAAGCPLAAPSANRSGAPSPTNAKRVLEDMDGRIAAIVDGGDCQVGVESTVVDLSGYTPRLLRPGGVTPEQLQAVLGDLVIDPAVTAQLEEGAKAASPGMKYKHYAPKAKVVLVKASPSAFATFVNQRKAEHPTALCFDGEQHLLQVPTLTYGKRNDPAAQAKAVFDALRRLDEMGATVVYATCPDSQGIGLAVYNRLLRAAGFEVITLD
jgi:L-threonylcarbamoyladenylate synthase